MNTYRVFTLDTTDVEKPVLGTAFIQASKYQDAWQAARAILANDDKAAGRQLFEDIACKKAIKVKAGDPRTVVKVLDCTVRNKKLDKASLADILADTSLTAEDRIAKITALSK